MANGQQTTQIAREAPFLEDFRRRFLQAGFDLTKQAQPTTTPRGALTKFLIPPPKNPQAPEPVLQAPPTITPIVPVLVFLNPPPITARAALLEIVLQPPPPIKLQLSLLVPQILLH